MISVIVSKPIFYATNIYGMELNNMTVGPKTPLNLRWSFFGKSAHVRSTGTPRWKFLTTKTLKNKKYPKTWILLNVFNFNDLMTGESWRYPEEKTKNREFWGLRSCYLIPYHIYTLLPILILLCMHNNKKNYWMNKKEPPNTRKWAGNYF